MKSAINVVGKAAGAQQVADILQLAMLWKPTRRKNTRINQESAGQSSAGPEPSSLLRAESRRDPGCVAIIVADARYRVFVLHAWPHGRMLALRSWQDL